jgi:DNA polymerase
VLKELYEEMRDCQKCSLCQGRTNLVFGAGNEKAEIVFVGEAPGYYEDKEGKPFVGQAGKVLDKLLDSIGLKREDVYIANVLKCRPPENRDPLPEEIQTCKPYLFKQIEIIKPRVVCTLGNFATQTILEKKVGITKVRGKPLEVKNFFIFPLFHPAAALHQNWVLEPLKEDFRKLKEFLASGVEVKPESSQMELF